MSLCALSAELLLCVTSNLQKQDLLNLSLTCKHLRHASEPELFREYTNISRRGHSFLPFLRRIILQPDLSKHVRKLHLRAWTTLVAVTDNGPTSESIVRQYSKQRDIRGVRGTQMTEADRVLLIQAARNAGVIEELASLDGSSCNPGGVHKATCAIPLSPIPRATSTSDRTFCERLRAGCEDPLVSLLIALLPNVRDIVLDGVPSDIHALIWQPKHGFSALRTLTACAAEGALQWPLDFFQPLLVWGKLRILKASHATSGRLQLTRRESMTPELPPLVLLPEKLALERVELENCCLRASDLQPLLRSCSGLRNFLYTSRRREAAPFSPSPAEFVELLKPLQNTLEGLILDVEVHRNEGKTDDKLALIHSLAHMTALKVLVTTPEMWRSGTVEDATTNNHKDGSGEQRLSVRIPPNVETLVFGMSEAEKTTSPSQLSDVVRTRTAMLPNLTNLSVGGIDSAYVQAIKQLYLDLDSFASAGPRKLHAEIGPIYVRSVFDATQLSHTGNEVRWTERMYTTSPTEDSLFARAYERIRRGLPR